MIKKALAGAGIAVAILLATPLAANAATYVPATAITVSDATPAPGQPTTVTFSQAFTPSESVSFTLTGENGAGATLAAISSKSITKAASATGTTSVVVTPPANATGSYSLTATGLTSGIVGTAAVTVVAADGSTTDGLAYTGGTLPIAAIWIAGGVLALGVVLVMVVGIRRRNLRTN